MITSQRTETEIQKAIMEYLALRRVFCYRSNSIAVRGRKIGKLGRPDITGIMPDGSGRYLGIEVKAMGGKQSPDQIDYQAGVEKHGGVYILAYSVEDVIQGLKQADVGDATKSSYERGWAEGKRSASEDKDST